MTPRQMRMKLRLERMKLFKNATLREYESFVWIACTRPQKKIEDVPFFLKRQAE